MNARDNFANASFYAGLLTEISDVLAAFSDDDASIFCADESTKSKCLLSRGRGRVPILKGS